MRYLGIDYGTRRIGISYADELGIPFPLPAATEPSQQERVDHLLEILSERKIDAIVIGYPLNMNNSVGFKAKEVDTFIQTLQENLSLPIYKTDERLTSEVAKQNLAKGRPNKKNSPKQQQKQRKSGQIDSAAACLILEDFLANQNVAP